LPIATEQAYGVEGSYETILEEKHCTLEEGYCPGKDSRRAKEPHEEASVRQPPRLAEGDVQGAVSGGLFVSHLSRPTYLQFLDSRTGHRNPKCLTAK
jgi:hypothetical protein